MAYQLNFDGSNDYVSTPAISITTDFTVEIEIEYVATSGFTFFASAWPGTNSRWYVGTDDNQFRFFHGTIGSYNGTVLNDGQVYKLTVERLNGDVNLYLDGALETTLTDTSDWKDIERFGSSLDDRFYTPSKLRWWSFTDGVNNRFYDADASNGTGSVLPDTASNQDGTLTNFPTDDSQWVFFGSAVETPINLGVTNLTDTSARLTWDQG